MILFLNSYYFRIRFYFACLDPTEHARHFPGHNFTGPGTHAVARIQAGIGPTNGVDACSMVHDLAYGFIKEMMEDKSITKAQSDRMTRLADEEFVANVNKVPSGELTDHSQFLAVAAMRAKMIAENAGIISHNKFVGGKTAGAWSAFRPDVQQMKQYQNRIALLPRAGAWGGFDSPMDVANALLFRKIPGNNPIYDAIGRAWHKAGGADGIIKRMEPKAGRRHSK